MLKNTAVLNLAFILIYIPVAKLGMWLAVEPGNVTPLYPAAGIAFLAYLRFGPRILPGIFTGGMLGNLLSMPTETSLMACLLAATLIGVGEALASHVAGRLAQLVGSPERFLLSARNSVLFYCICLFWLISPTVGVSALCMTGLAPWQEYGFLWLTWWLGDALGIMLVVPVALLFLHRAAWQTRTTSTHRLTWHGLIYVSALAILISADYPIIYLLIPITVIAVSLYRQWGAAVGSTAPFLCFLPANIAGIGFYAGFEAPFGLIYLQLLLGVNAFVAFYIAATLHENSELSHQIVLATEEADFDPLTRVLNRRGFFKKAAGAISDAQHIGQNSLLVMLDIDDFKTVNDTYGHGVGDVVLKRVADTLREHTRTGDLVARFGGEEFLILLTTVEPQFRHSVVDKLLDALRCIDWSDVFSDHPVTCSAGCLVVKNDEDIQTLIHQADHLLYRAKARGKNRYEFAASER